MRLRTLLLVAIGYVLVLAIIALEVPLAVSLRDRVDAEVRAQAASQADVLAATSSDLLGPAQRGQLAALARTAARSLRGRVLVVDRTGAVVADSAGSATAGASFAGRDEIAAALLGRPRQVRRHSATLKTDLLATAVPIARGGKTVGAVRVTQDVAAVHRAERRTLWALAVIGAIVLAAGLMVGLFLAARIAGPIRRLEATARRVADGDLGARTRPQGSSEQRSLAGSMNAMTERLAALLDRQRRFVADASHQLRTPLTGLRLRLEGLRARSAAPVDAADLDAALEEVDRLAAIVADLLELSQAERSGTRPGAGADAITAAHQAAARWRAAAGAAGARLLIDTGSLAELPTPWPVGDLDRMLDALVENALLYGRPAGGTVRIVVEPGAILVEDDGPGVAPEEREVVFERFHRGRAGRAGPAGTGLGLAIVRALARGGGGSVTLHERRGGGTVARLALAGAEDQEIAA